MDAIKHLESGSKIKHKLEPLEFQIYSFYSEASTEKKQIKLTLEVTKCSIY